MNFAPSIFPLTSVLVGTLGTPSPPLSKCFLLTGNKKGGASKAEVKSGWYGAPSTMGPLFPARLVFYNRSGGWARGGREWPDDANSLPDSGPQTYLLLHMERDRKREKNIKKLQRKGEGRRGGGLTEFTPNARDPPNPRLLLQTPRSWKGALEQTLRSSQPPLNS